MERQRFCNVHWFANYKLEFYLILCVYSMTNFYNGYPKAYLGYEGEFLK